MTCGCLLVVKVVLADKTGQTVVPGRKQPVNFLLLKSTRLTLQFYSFFCLIDLFYRMKIYIYVLHAYTKKPVYHVMPRHILL